MTILKSLREILSADNIEKGMPQKQISIIIAAIELFSDKGYEATTTSEIAKKANVSEGTIYRYYKNKKDLLMAVPACLSQMPFAQILLDDFDKIFINQYENVEDFLKAFIINRKNFARDNLPIIKILFQEIAFHPELREKISKTVLFSTVEKVIQMIDSFKKRGQIIDIPSPLIIKLISTSIIGYFFTRYIAMIDTESDEDEGIDHLINYIMNGICISKK